ncbi:MAG: TonB-dependent receptor [Pseudohongiellaceae bacterium]
MFKKKPLVSAISAATIMATTAGMNTAYAQDDALEEVIVTGSRLVRTDLASVSPLQIVDSEEFIMSGSINIEQKLAELPMTLPSFGPSSNNPGDGTALVNLRGLGTSRTLVLVNGRRYMPSQQSGEVDLNTIPATLIKQVDVITGGASAVYGSDALAGVVNIQLVDDFEGVEINSTYDTTAHDDAEKRNFDITIGGNFAEGRGNATVYLGYVKREPLFADARSFSFFALGDANPVGTPGQSSSTGVGGPLAASGSSGIPGTRVFGGPTIDLDGIPGNGDDFTLGRFNQDGSGAPWRDPDDRFNYAPDNYIQLPQERYMLSGFSHYDITETTRAFAEFTFVHNKVPQELAPTPAFLGDLEVNPDSPFFGAGVQAALAGVRSDTNGDGLVDGGDNAFLPFIGRRMVENGSRQSEDTRQGYRLLVGLEGEFNDNWSYNVYASRSYLENSNFLNNDVSDSRFRQAVLVTDDGSACQAASGGCAPLNIFGEGNISAAAIGFVNIGATNVTKIEQSVYNGSITGDLPFAIGDTAPISVAFGFERRQDESSFRPDSFLSSGDVLGFNAGKTTVGKYDVDEWFGEINIPLLEDAPFAQSLTLWAAVRASDYSNVGNVSSSAYALNWAPNDMFTFRVGVQDATRAPNVSELFLGQANGFPGAVDPCSVDGAAGSAPSAALTALCVAHGVAPGQVGVFTQANSQIEGLFGGNPDLQEETSDTFTLGVIMQPIDDLDIAIDFFEIEVEDVIDVLGGGLNNTLDICYNQLRNASDAFCQAISRRPDGNVDVVNILNENIGKRELSGIDLNVNYVRDFDFGFFGSGSTLSFSMRSTFLKKFEDTPVVGLTSVNKCEGTFGQTCGRPRPESLYNTRFTWNTGPLGVSLLWRHMTEVDDDRIENEGVVANTLSVPSLDAIDYVDLSLTYQYSDELRINFGIKNMFDEQPTFIGSVQQQANTYPETYDLFGTRYWVSASYHFR